MNICENFHQNSHPVIKFFGGWKGFGSYGPCKHHAISRECYTESYRTEHQQKGALECRHVVVSACSHTWSLCILISGRIGKSAAFAVLKVIFYFIFIFS